MNERLTFKKMNEVNEDWAIYNALMASLATTLDTWARRKADQCITSIDFMLQHCPPEHKQALQECRRNAVQAYNELDQMVNADESKYQTPPWAQPRIKG